MKKNLVCILLFLCTLLCIPASTALASETIPELLEGENRFVSDGSEEAGMYVWTAPQNGTITIAMSDDNPGGWQYAIDRNEESGRFQYCDDELSSRSQTCSVSTGDTLVLWVNTYDSEACMSIPGEVKFTMSYKTDEIPEEPEEDTSKIYHNTVTPVPYEFQGTVNELFYVFVQDGKKDTIFYNETDGCYHIGEADGPVLLVSLGQHPYFDSVSLIQTAKAGQLYAYDTDGAIVDYNQALLEYAHCSDSGLYPLTDDLRTILVEYGNVQGWYTQEDSSNYLFEDDPADAENAWLFNCCYLGALDLDRNMENAEITWTAGSADGPVIKIHAEYIDFKVLKINGEAIDFKNCTIEEGSTIITIKPEYLAALKTGDYMVSAVFYGVNVGEIVFDVTLTITAPESITPPKEPEDPEDPKDPEEPEIPEDPEEPEIPETPETPEEPETPEDPEEPETPEIPETPEEPEIPETPEVPETPEIPEEPEIPEIPEEPEIPETPEVPETPETPEVPETPETPETSETPEEPEIPQEPEYIVKPDVPKTGEDRSMVLYTGILGFGVLMCIHGMVNFITNRFIHNIRKKGYNLHTHQFM